MNNANESKYSYLSICRRFSASDIFLLTTIYLEPISMYCRIFILSIFISIAFCSNVQAQKTIVHTADELKAAVKGISPGNTILLADGVWKDIEIVFKGNGTKEAPITLEAQNIGKVSLEGESNFRIAGSYVIVNGLVFKNGHTPTSEVVLQHLVLLDEKNN